MRFGSEAELPQRGSKSTRHRALLGMVVFVLLGAAFLLPQLDLVDVPGSVTQPVGVSPKNTQAERDRPAASPLGEPVVNDGERIAAIAGLTDRTSIVLRLRTTGGRPWPNVTGCVHPFGASWHMLTSPATFLTDSAGCAEVPVVAGRWVVRVALDPEGYRKLNVEAGVPTQLDYVLDATLVVAGLVVDEAHRPLRDVEISVTTLGADSLRLEAARTDALGRFRLDVVGEECVVVARSVGYATASAHVQIPGNRTNREARPMILLQRASLLRGLVMSERGDRVAGCLVTASSLAAQTDDELPPGAESAVSLTDGSFVIERLAAAHQVVRAYAEGYMPWQGSVEVVAGVDAMCSIELRLSGNLSGRVQSRGGAPIADAIVVGYSGKDAACRTRSEANGEFTIAPLSRGLARVWAYHKTAGWGCVEHELADVGQVVVTLVEGPTMRGRCIDQSGAPVAGVDVNLRMVDAFSGREFMGGISARSGEDGSFRVINVAPGAEFLLSANKAGFRGQVRRFAGVADVELVLTSSFDDCILAGRVVDPEGRPVVGANVLVHGSSLGSAFGCATSEDGRFAISDLSRGSLSITLEHAEFAKTTTAKVVAVGGRQELGDLAILRGGRVRVAVEMAGGAAPSGYVYLWNADGTSGSKFQLVNGAAISETLPSGEYQGLIDASNCESRTFRCAVAEGRATLLSQMLRPGLPMALVFELPTIVPSTVSLVGTLTRGGETLHRFTLPGSAGVTTRMTSFRVDDGPYTIEARAGDAVVKAEFHRDSLPVDGGRPMLTLRLALP